MNKLETRRVRLIVIEVLYGCNARDNNQHYHPDIWLEIFRRVFGEEPDGQEDGRFNYLLWVKEGYRALRYVHLYERLVKG